MARVEHWDLRGLRAWCDPRWISFPGYLPYGLAIAGLALLVYGADARRWPVDGRSLALSLVAYAAPLVILALGPQGGPGLGWLWEHVPGLGHYRVVERFAHLVSLPIAVLGGVAAAVVEHRARSAGRAWLAWPCGLLVVGAFCWESQRSVPAVQLFPAPAVPSVYSWLARRDGPILEIPAGMVRPGGINLADSTYVYWSVWHGRPIVNGYSGYAPAAYPLVLGLAAELPGDEPLATLSRLTGVRWLVVHLWNLTPGERSRWDAPGAPVPVVRFGNDAVFAIPPATEDWRTNYQRPSPGTTLAGTPVVTLGPADAADVRVRDPGVVGARATTPVTVEVRNTGVQAWPALTVDADRRVMIRLHWDGAGGARLPMMSIPLPRDLQPGDAVTVSAVLGTPSIRGSYVLVAEISQGVRPLRTTNEPSATHVSVTVS